MDDRGNYCEDCCGNDGGPREHCQDCPKLTCQPGWFLVVKDTGVMIYGCTHCGFTGYANGDAYVGTYGICPSCGKEPDKKKLSRKFKKVVVVGDDGSKFVQEVVPRKNTSRTR